MQFRQKAIVTLVLIGIISLTLVSTLIHLLTESWWFDAVGFADVFWTRITWQVAIWAATFAIFSLFLWFNCWLASRLTSDRSFQFLAGSELEPHTNTISKLTALVLIFIVAISAAGASARFWETSLKFLNATSFDRSDPIYSQDIAFYLFKLPFYEGLQSWLFALLMSGLIAAFAIYLLKGVIQLNFVAPRLTRQGLAGQKLRLERQWQNYFQGQQKTHIVLLLAAIAIMVAVDFWLKRYDLLYSADGVVWGAGYTDTHARLFAYWVMGIGALILGVFLTLAVWFRRNALPLYGIAVYLLILLLVNGIYPELQQRFIVEPNELDKELPYIKHNLEFTREAYGLAEIEVQNYPVSSELTAEALQGDRGTIQNIRLWDYRPLLSTYRQLQAIRPYYQFNDVDIDRYTLNGNYRQVMLSARELSYERIPQRAKTWVNQRLKYTHGYGLVMSPVNQVTPDGLPELLIKNIPPVSQVDLEVQEPAIYYGEETNDYIFTGATTPEFDYPQGNENAFTTYEGIGGVPIPNMVRKLAYAYELSSLKILISNYFTNNSRIHYYRNIEQRVSHVAPFLKFDRDPYIAVIDGRLQWIIDAYTTSNSFPYSEPVTRGINYIRNSVKVLVDAKDGTMQFFVVDENEPVLATYRKIFPDLFLAQDAIPPQVRDNFRYPLDLYKIQAKMYLAYHMNDPQVFYNREDLWRFATENYEGNQQPIEPYYQIMNLPGESREEFALILPFTPVNKDNMIAWMAARSDGENYGKVLLYEFPKQKLIYGPFQIEARIDQNPEISQQLTLWSQKGSRVIRGDLLVIPIDGSLLYVEPVYLRAEQGELPELRRVIVAYEKEVAMRPTLEESLTAIFGNEPESQVAQPATDLNVDVDSNLIQQAAEAFERSETAQRQGNWAEYGRYQQRLKEILQQLQE
ncbi:UPF0182 family protein [Pleurocapsales cyanobacterium LEGE 10410]|nr:UPF0182 family protein [Pleurocapsales cyanobacterium LEGE 10410]